MKERTPEGMTIETLDKISMLKSASECSIECENRKVKTFGPIMPSIGPSSMNAALYLMTVGNVSICHGGYENNIQKCPKYLAEIDKLKESAKTLVDKI